MDNRQFAAKSPALSTLLALLVAIAITSKGVAQGPPSQLNSTITSANSLSDAQRQEVRDYAKYWSDRMVDPAGSTEQVESARKELLRPLLVAIQPSAAFRFEYAGFVTPSLEPLFQIQAVDRPHATFNAALVLGELGARRALDVLLDHADSRSEDRREVRIQASMNAAKMLRKYGNDPDALKPREIGAAVRSLRNAAQREDDPVVLRHLFSGIQSVDTPEARDDLIEALNTVVDKIRNHEDGVSPLIDPFYVAVADLRTTLLASLTAAERNRIGVDLGPVLGKFLDAAAEKWDSAHADPALQKKTAGPIRTCEDLLKRIIGAASSSAPKTSLRENWDAGLKQQFISEVGQWGAVLAKPPFSN